MCGKIRFHQDAALLRSSALDARLSQAPGLAPRPAVETAGTQQNPFMSEMLQNAPPCQTPLRVIIIGGGYTGVAYAIHLIGNTACALEIGIVEPASLLGRGIAYGTQEHAHRINVPSDRMSVYPSDPTHATRWLFSHGVLPDASSTDARGHHYVARAHYGAYVADTLSHCVAGTGGRVTLIQHRGSAVAINPGTSHRHIVQIDSGQRLPADLVVLTCGHAVPVLPCEVVTTVLADLRRIADPWKAGALRAIAADDNVLLVGTGLTMADVLASLVAAGHRGRIKAISRRGLLPKQQGQFANFDFLGDRTAPTTARGLLRLARQRIEENRYCGWHPVLDGLRAQLQTLWPALPPAEQLRVVRRLLPFWEIHRFRIGTQVQATLSEAIATGKLLVRQAGIVGIRLENDQLFCLLRPRGAPAQEEAFERVIFCTGPEKNIARNPLIAAMLADGTVKKDAIGVGLAVDRQSRVIDAHGRVVDGMYAYGPITRGTFGEMTGAPDIAQHIDRMMQQFNPVAGLRERLPATI